MRGHLIELLIHLNELNQEFFIFVRVQMYLINTLVSIVCNCRLIIMIRKNRNYEIGD